MRPTVEQHRAALKGHAGRVERYQKGGLTADEWRPIRLSYGLYYQLDHTSHMQRIKIPGGIVSAAQMDVLADLADRYGRGVSHITTRQDLQIHWVPLEGVMDLYDRLLAVGITTRGACADSVRNATACPYAGVASDEPFDVSPYLLALHEYFLFNPLNLTLPRKFKPAVEGCSRDCAQVPINDVGFYAKVRDGARGFAVWAGGGLGSQPFLAQHVAEFVPADDILVWAEAVVRVHHRYGERKNRHKARLKYVMNKMGAEKFRATITSEAAVIALERGDELRAQVREVVAEFRVPPPAASRPAVPPLPGFDHWQRTNAHAQKQEGYRAALVTVPLGDLTTAQMRALGRLSVEYGNGTLRLTNDQNAVIPWVAEAALPAVHAALVEQELGDADVSTIHDVVSCPGMDYCSLAITRSMGMAERLRAHLASDAETANGFAEKLGVFAVKISGCPNSCGQHHVGDVGLTGHLVKDADGVERPYYSVLIGGGVGEGQGRIGKRVGRFPEERAPAVIAAVARLYASERRDAETFPAFIKRVGTDRLGEVAKAAAAAPA
jgi:sulfite reductase beta subunit-like hemoprotein